MKTEDALREWGDYQGRQDKPDDFDDFWDKAKKEVDSLGLHYELTPTNHRHHYDNHEIEK